jgi:hypothetical protein
LAQWEPRNTPTLGGIERAVVGASQVRLVRAAFANSVSCRELQTSHEEIYTDRLDRHLGIVHIPNPICLVGHHTHYQIQGNTSRRTLDSSLTVILVVPSVLALERILDRGRKVPVMTLARVKLPSDMPL